MTDALQLTLRLLEVSELQQRAAERDAGGQIVGIGGEAGPAHGDGFFGPPGAAELFGKLGESNRRRILVEPASKVLDARSVWHEPLLWHECRQSTTVTVLVTDAVRPAESVIVSRTT